jgi:predicted ATP-grasp superfamily ATP-dependent carboligase
MDATLMSDQMIDVLLLDAEVRQTLACMRTYADAGLLVGALACESEAWWAPSLQSTRCELAAVAPDYGRDPSGYVDVLLDVAIGAAPRLIIPAHDGSIEAVRARREEIENIAPLALGSEEALDIAVSKARTLALATELGVAVPRSVRVRSMDEVALAIAEVGLPAVIKPEQSWVERDGAGTRLSSEAVRTVDEAKRTLEWVLRSGGEALVQQFLPGRREAISLFFAQDRFWARVAQVSHRDWPVLGGVSVLCETIPLLPDITAPSEALVRAMGLEGCSMVEYRRDVDGRPVLMEVNPRMGGSVALPLRAGVDFPQLLWDWKTGEPLTDQTSYRVGRRLRWLAGDVWNLKCVWDSQGQTDVPQRGRATATFLLDFLRPANKLDIVDRGDLRPAIAEMDKVVLRHAKGRVRRLRRALTPAGR